MNIYFLGWGSLIWDKERKFPIDGDWKIGGPTFKIEFSRISSDGRLTLVIDKENGVDVSTFYAKSIRSSLDKAIDDLRIREGTINKRIGYVDVINNHSSLELYPDQINVVEKVKNWCKANSYDAAVWTALPSQFQEKTDEVYSPENAFSYLENLPKSKKEKAIEYIQKAPKEVNTDFRSYFESKIN